MITRRTAIITGLAALAEYKALGQFTVPSHTGALASAGAPALPTTNLQAWWKADSLSASPVTAWADSSVNGVNLTKDSSSPVWTASQINGLPAVTFNGSTDYFHTSAAINYSGVISVYAIFKPAVVNSSQSFMSNATGARSASLQINNSGLQELDYQITTNLGTSNTPLTAGVWCELGVTYDGSNSHYYLNGVADGGASVSASGFDPINALGTGWNAGIFSQLHGQLAEFVIYNSGTYQSAVHTYFQSRYGI
jgi:hypothetical protein